MGGLRGRLKAGSRGGRRRGDGQLGAAQTLPGTQDKLGSASRAFFLKLFLPHSLSLSGVLTQLKEWHNLIVH